MTWYAAHIIMVFRIKGRHTRIPVWENIVLIKAETEEEAFAKAEELGRQDEGADDGTLRWGGQPATLVFAGVRKLTLCVDPDKRPNDGTEVTYIEMELPSEQALEKFLAGEPVNVKIDDGFPDDEEDVSNSAPATAVKGRAGS